LGFVRTSNRCLVFDSRVEESNESYDRTWRRWLGFCTEAGRGSDPFLNKLSPVGRELFVRSFIVCLRTAQWKQGSGKINGERKTPMVSGTLRKATGHLATAFRNHLKPSPLHVEGSAQLLPATRSLFKAFTNADPAPKRQRAITPKLLRGMYTLAGSEFLETRDTPAAIAADLAILGLFFAMRSCENTTTPKPGRTKTVDMNGVTFLDSNKREIPHDHPGIALAAHVTLLFADQKNRDKNARRSQKRTDDPVLCPVRRAASLIQRIRRLVPEFSGSTTINTYVYNGPTTLQLASGFLRSQLRHTCTALGGKAVFGYDGNDIGTKSIRSGAAMGLFLANHSTERIRLMGRWLSQAFLVYIRPQVIEWTNNMSSDMIRHDSFTDASGFDTADPEIARAPPRRINGPDNSLIIPSFHLDH
jgi:hypothetical protein